VTRSFNRLLPPLSVAAEVAGLSPVVPAIRPKTIYGMIWRQEIGKIGCNPPSADLPNEERAIANHEIANPGLATTG
jgi:hypothetical protein